MCSRLGEFMKKLMVNRFALLFLIAFFFAIPFVLGATNILDQVVDPFKGVDFAAFYLQNSAFVDGAIYLTFFIGLCVAIGDNVPLFKNRKLVPIVVGIIFGLSLAVTGKVMNFKLINDVGPFGILIVILVFGAFAYIGMKKWGANGYVAASVAILILFALLRNLGGSSTAKSSSAYASIMSIPLVGGIASLLQLFSVIGLITGAVSTFGNSVSGAGNIKRASRRQDEFENSWRTQFDKQNANANNYVVNEQDIKNTIKQLQDLENMESSLENRENLSRQQQEEYTKKLNQYLTALWQLQNNIRSIKLNEANPAIEQYKAQLGTYSNQIKSILDTARKIIVSLDQSMKNSSELLKKEISGIENEINNDLMKLLKDNQKLLQIEEKLESVSQKSPKIYADQKKNLDVIKTEIQTASTGDAQIKSDDAKIMEEFKLLEAVDAIDMTNLGKMMTLVDTSNNENSFDTITIAYNQQNYVFQLISGQTFQRIIQNLLSPILRDITTKIRMEEEITKILKNRSTLLENFMKIQADLTVKFNNTIDGIDAALNNTYETDEQILQNNSTKIDDIEKNDQDPVIAEAKLEKIESDAQQIHDKNIREIITDEAKGLEKGEKRRGKKSGEESLKKDKSLLDKSKKNVGAARSNKGRFISNKI